MTHKEIFQNLLNGETLINKSYSIKLGVTGHLLGMPSKESLLNYDWTIKLKTKELSADDVRRAFDKIGLNLNSTYYNDLIKELGL